MEASQNIDASFYVNPSLTFAAPSTRRHRELDEISTVTKSLQIRDRILGDMKSYMKTLITAVQK